MFGIKRYMEENTEKYKDNEYIDYDYDLDEEIIEKYNVGEIVPVVIFEKMEKK